MGSWPGPVVMGLGCSQAREWPSKSENLGDREDRQRDTGVEVPPSPPHQVSVTAKTGQEGQLVALQGHRPSVGDLPGPTQPLGAGRKGPSREGPYSASSTAAACSAPGTQGAQRNLLASDPRAHPTGVPCPSSPRPSLSRPGPRVAAEAPAGTGWFMIHRLLEGNAHKSLLWTEINKKPM